MRRRPFMIGCAGVATTPAFAHLVLPTTGALAPQSVAADLQAATVLSDLANPQQFVLRIHGWDTPDDRNSAPRGEMWVHVNSSWRAAWR